MSASLAIVIACRRCGLVLGTSDGPSLLIGASSIDQQTTLTCTRCGAARTWRPRGLQQPDSRAIESD